MKKKTKSAKDALDIIVKEGTKRFGPDFPRLVQAEYTRLKNESGTDEWDSSLSANGIVPSIRIDVVVDSIGYQADIFCDGKYVGTECRDLSTDMRKQKDKDKVINDLYKKLVKAIDSWRAKN